MTDLDNEDRGTFIWYELMSADPAGSKAFYDRLIGWDIDAANSIPDGGDVDYRMIKRADGGFAGGLLAMTPEMIAGGGRPGWYGYVHVPNVDTAAQAMVDAGGMVHMGPHDMTGVGRMAMVADPQGAAIYLMTPTPPADAPDTKSDVFDPMKPQHMRWNELQTDDPAGAVQLYSQLFGWKQDGMMSMGEMGDYLFIGKESGMIGAIMPRMPGSPGSVWTYYIGVEDIDRAVGTTKDSGGTIVQEPVEIPGGEFSAVCADPHGVVFGLVGPRKGA